MSRASDLRRTLALTLVLFMTWTRPAFGVGLVKFDIVPLVGCHDVTTAEFARWNPDERLVAANLQVSSLVAQGAESRLQQYLVRVESLAGTTWITDFSPKTETSSRVVGRIAIEDATERGSGQKLSATGDLNGIAGIDASAQHDNRRSLHARYETVPDHELVVASGTTRGGRGVYFKLRPTPQGTLEGLRDLQVVFRVPRGWRGERVLVYCYAWADQDGSRATPSADDQATFSVVLYAAGDAPAKLAAREFLQTEQQVRAYAWAHDRQLRKRTQPWKSAWNQLVGDDRRELPSHWLQDVTTQPARAIESEYYTILPSDLRQALQSFAAADKAMQSLGNEVVGDTDVVGDTSLARRRVDEAPSATAAGT